MSTSPPSSKRTAWPAEAVYLFGNSAEPVVIVSMTSRGEPVIARRDGSMAVVSLHRVRLTRRDLS